MLNDWGRVLVKVKWTFFTFIIIPLVGCIQGLLEKYSEYIEMTERDQKEKNRPFWQKLLLALGMGL